MTNVRSQRKSALETFAVLALGITFLLRYAPFLASRLLFGPFRDNVHIYGPIFSEVSRLASSGAVHGTVRKLDHYYSQLCLAAASAGRRSVVIAISWEGLWNTRVFHCGRSSGIGERLTAGNSRCSDVPDAICVGYYMDVCSAALRRRRACSRVSDGVRWYCVRTRRSCDRPDVHRYRRNDSAHRWGRLGDRARPHSMGKFQSESAYVEPGNGHCSQTRLD